MRSIAKLMKDWQFTGPDGVTAAVALPHTWNAKDGQDGGNDYWRGTCTYRTGFAAPAYDPAQQQLCTHDGGYSTFRAEIIMGTLFSLVDKLVSSLSATVVGIAVSFVGLQSLPTQYDPYTPGMNWVVIVLFCIIPMVAWAATLIAMKGYTLTGAKMKEIQAVNACRRDAVAKGMKLEEAMDKWQTMEQLPEEYRS